jgi:hypothetical protein
MEKSPELKIFLETGHLMYIVINSYSGNVRGVSLHLMKVGKGIESGLCASDRKSFLKPALEFNITQHYGEQKSELLDDQHLHNAYHILTSAKVSHTYYLI